MGLKVVIADDHEIVRVGLRQFFQGTDIRVAAEAPSGETAWRLVLKHQPDLALLDVRMKDGDGLTALGRIKLDLPTLPVLMFSAFDNPAFVARSVALGASGYLLKTIPRETLLNAIRAVARGETLWNREELRRAGNALSAPRLNAVFDVPFTQRESEVLALICEGFTNQQIAAKLSISYETVKEHVQHMFRKLGVSDRTQAAVWAVRNQLA